LAPFGPAVSEEKIFLTLANQKQELPLAAIFVGGMGIFKQTSPKLFSQFEPNFGSPCSIMYLIDLKSIQDDSHN
jgi:hypothetical protein